MFNNNLEFLFSSFMCAELLAVGHWKALTPTDGEQAKSLLLIALSSRAPATVNKYQVAFSRWQKFASDKSTPCLPADAVHFSMYLDCLEKTDLSDLGEVRTAAMPWPVLEGFCCIP